MSRVKKVCETSEFWGAKKRSCHYELEEIEPDELYTQLEYEIKYEGLDHIPNNYEFIHLECLDEECYEAEEIEFEIDPRDYLSSDDIEELERLIDKQYDDEGKWNEK